MSNWHVAIQGVCAWPNLQRLPDGTLIASIFNQPCHGLWEGDLDCWASEDEGETWAFRGRPAAHTPGTNRMNCAAGLGNSGDLIVLCSGWDHRTPVGIPTGHGGDARPIGPLVSRSSDGGRTWEVRDAFPTTPDGDRYIPFGNICRAADGALCVVGYFKRFGDLQGKPNRATDLLRSYDDGRTWGDAVTLNPIGCETDILHLGDGRWLAASRENDTLHIELLASEDDGRTWQRKMPISLPGQVTSHLTRLQDGRVLFTYGNRCTHMTGVDIRFSEDGGRSWGEPKRIADTPSRDSGYPSSVQLPDGRMVTAYYTQLSGRFHYEMRVVRWHPDAFK